MIKRGWSYFFTHVITSLNFLFLLDTYHLVGVNRWGQKYVNKWHVFFFFFWWVIGILIDMDLHGWMRWWLMVDVHHRTFLFFWGFFAKGLVTNCLIYNLYFFLAWHWVHAWIAVLNVFFFGEPHAFFLNFSMGFPPKIHARPQGGSMPFLFLCGSPLLTSI